jgi:hypothetical protein
MEYGIVLLMRHRTERFVPTSNRSAPALFSQIVVDTMVGYNDARGGEFDRTPMTVSYFTDRVCVMLVGKITDDLYDQVHRRVDFEINRRVFDKTDSFGV